MADKTNPAVLAEIERENERLNASILDAVMTEIVGLDSLAEVDERMPIALAAGFAVIIEHWRADAQARVDARKQGAKGAQTKVEYAAGLLAGIAVNLRTLGENGTPSTDGASAPEVRSLSTMALPPGMYAGETCFCGVPVDDHTHDDTPVRVRGCAPEDCGGTSYDPCRSSGLSAGMFHDHDIATPGIDEQCRKANHEGSDCLRIADHDGDHTDLKTGWTDAATLTSCAAPELCAEPHLFMDDVTCSLPLAHPGAHSAAGVGEWTTRPPTVPLPAEIFAGQCIATHDGDRCMLPATHTSRHTGTRGAKWEGGGMSILPGAKMFADEAASYTYTGPTLTAAEAVTDNEAHPEFDLMRLAARGVGLISVATIERFRETGAFSENAIAAIVARDAGGMDAVGSPPFPGDPGYCRDCDLGGHTCKGCGYSTSHDAPYDCSDMSCVANEPSIVSADPAIPAPPVIVSAVVQCSTVLNDGHTEHLCTKDAGHEGDHSLATIGFRPASGGNVASAGVAPPSVVPVAFTPKSLGIRRLTWAELEAPPANADALRPGHRSVSQLDTYSCGMKYRLQRYGETTDVPSWSLVGGLVIHAVIERMEASGWDRLNAEIWPEVFEEIVAAQEAASGITRDLWIAADGGKENGEWWLVEGEKMSQNFRLWRKKMISSGWKITAVEHEINTPPEFAGVPVKGFLDLVLWHEATGVVLLPDVKSGRNRPQSRTQLDVYGRALDLLGVPGVDRDKIVKIEAAYLMLRKGELIERHDVMVEGMAPAEIKARFTTMDKAERAGIYLPNPSALCGSCGVRAGCPVGRPAAREVVAE